MKLNFRKIASVLTSAVMLSSTIGFAAAANYPAPFVKSGSADVAVVWGSAAASTDLVAVTDITADLQAQLASQTASSSGSSSVSVSGADYVVLDMPSSKLHLGAGLSSVFGRSVTKTDLPNLLADGTYMDSDNNNHAYTQKVDVANLSITQVDNSNYKQDAPTLGVQVSSGGNLLNYTLSFTDKPAFNKLANTDIDLMGKTYRFLSVASNGTAHPELVLLDSANSVTLNQGDTKTVTVGNSTYDVSIAYIDGTKVKLVINGETTNSLSDGSTQKLKDGAYVGIKDVSSQGYSGGIAQVEFSIGSGKLDLTDGSNVQMNDNTVNGLTAVIQNTSNGASLSTIGLVWNADQDTFVMPDSSPVMPGFGALKLSFAGMSYPAAEVTSLTNDGDQAIQLQVPLVDGSVNLDILAINDSGNYTMIGKDSSHLLQTSVNSSLLVNMSNSGNTFVASWASGKQAESYPLYANSFTTNNNVNYTTFYKRNDASFSQKVTTGDSMTLGNVVLTVGAIDVNARTVLVSANANTDFRHVYTAGGLKIRLPYVNTTSLNLSKSTGAEYANQAAVNAAVTAAMHGNVPGELGYNQVIYYNDSSSHAATSVTLQSYPSTYDLQFTEADKDGNIASGSQFNLTLGTTGTSSIKTSVDHLTAGTAGSQVSASQEVGSSSSLYMSTIYSAAATEIDLDKSPDQHTAKITYHPGESFGELVLTAPNAEVTGSSTPVSTTGVKKLGSVAVSDAEAASVAGNNLIVVGGSCVNSVAADLLGGALCGANFEQKTGAGSGQFVIETFSRSNGKVATLVAGYDAADTTNAAKYLVTQGVDTTVGKTYVGTSATSAKLVTATPASSTTTATNSSA